MQKFNDSAILKDLAHNATDKHLTNVFNLKSDPKLICEACKVLLTCKLNQNSVGKFIIPMTMSLPPLSISNIKMLVNLFKLIASQDAKFDEPFIKFIFKCSFVGIVSSVEGSDVSSSDSDGGYQDKNSRLLAKLRSLSQILMQISLRSQSAYYQNNWQIFCRGESNLVQLLLVEQNKKTRINIITTLIILLDLLNIQKWIQGYDFTKITLQSFQPKGIQLYQLAKQLHETTIQILTQWRTLDMSIVAMLLKLELVIMNSSSIIQKLNDQQGVQPLLSLFYQLISVPEQYNMKISLLQIMNQLFKDGLREHKIAQYAFKNIHDLHKLQDPLIQLFLTECFIIIHRVQKINMTLKELADLKQLLEDPKLIQLMYRSYEEIQDLPDDEFFTVLKETLTGSPDLVQVGLNIISNQARIPQNLDLSTVYNQIFKEGSFNTSQLKICFYKALGAIANENNVHQFQNMFANVKGSNIHVLEKSSWALANICQISLQPHYALLMHFACNQKEKICTNGLRGLGFYLQKTQIIHNKDEIIQCYIMSLESSNPKICWNASTSIQNACSNEIYADILTNPNIEKSITKVLQRRDNLKAQIHSMELVLRMPHLNVLSVLIEMIKNQDEHDNFLEQKYVTRLREQVLECLSSRFQSMDQQIIQASLEESFQQEETLSKIHEELIKYLMDHKPQNAIVLVAKLDMTRDEILSLVEEDNENIFKNQFEQQTTPVQKYLKVLQPDQNNSKNYNRNFRLLLGSHLWITVLKVMNSDRCFMIFLTHENLAVNDQSDLITELWYTTYFLRLRHSIM